MPRDARKHVICFEQGVKCFCEIFLAWDRQPFVSSKIKARFDCWNFTHFITLFQLRICLAQIINMAGVKEESQENEIKCWLLPRFWLKLCNSVEYISSECELCSYCYKYFLFMFTYKLHISVDIIVEVQVRKLLT